MSDELAILQEEGSFSHLIQALLSFVFGQIK